jgi:hypothetical protein
MSYSAKVKGGTYADRPGTPLGESTGITSAPTSEHPSRKSTPPPNPNPYHYQPAIAATRPELSVLRRNSSNYAQAHAESLTKLTQLSLEQSEESRTRNPGRSYSFSAEDLKRSHYHHLLKDDEQGEQDKDRQALKSPGIGNSADHGRHFGFTSTG